MLLGAEHGIILLIAGIARSSEADGDGQQNGKTQARINSEAPKPLHPKP